MCLVTLHAHCFGLVAEAVDASAIEIAVHEGCTVDALRAELTKRFPQLSNATFRVAVDRRMADGETVIPEHAEIAILPPFAGG